MIKIRKAKSDDLTAIYNLVVELAIYEKEPDAVTTTLKDYETAFNEKLIDAIVAVKSETVIGMALFYMTFSTWKGKMLYLEDFYVNPLYRSSGIGQKMFDKYLEEAKRLGCSMTKWQVLDWNTKAIKFYKRNGATIENSWYNGKIIF